MNSPDTQPHGNFVAFLVRDKQPGDKKPTFDGRLTLPALKTELNIALWAHEFTDPKSGEVKMMFNGRADAVSPTDAPLDQVAALVRQEGAADIAELGALSLSPRQVVLFPNRFKDDEPAKQRPDFWGAFNPGQGQPLVRISAWMRKDRYKHAMMTGATSYPLPGKNEAAQQDAAPSLAEVEAQAIQGGSDKDTRKKKVAGR